MHRMSDGTGLNTLLYALLEVKRRIPILNIHKCLAPDRQTLMDDTTLDNPPLDASQYLLQASLCADRGTTRRKTVTSQPAPAPRSSSLFPSPMNMQSEGATPKFLRAC